jgi:PAS domain S-box-containing protein
MSAPPQSDSMPASKLGLSDAEREERLRTTLRQAYRSRVLGEGHLVLAGHPALALLVVVLSWDELAHPLLLLWAATIVAAALYRVIALRRFAGRAELGSLPGVDASLILLALAWGIGTASALALLPTAEITWALVILFGIVGGAINALAADPRRFRFFLAGIVLPLPIGLAARGLGRSTVEIGLLLSVFTVLAIVLHGRVHATWVDHLRTMAELALREHEARERGAYLSALLGGAPIAIVVQDAVGRIQYVNPAFEGLFGFVGQEASGRELAELVVPPDQRAESAAIDARVRAGEVVREEVERRHRDGHLVHVRLSAVPIALGGPGGLLMLYEDIGQRKRAEQAQAKLIQQLQDALANVKTLRGLLPICASCRKVRDDQGYWSQIEVYVRDHSEADFSHGLCPDCMQRLYGDLLESDGAPS